MKIIAAAALAGFCSHAVAGMDDPVVAAEEAGGGASSSGGGIMSSPALLLGLAGAAWMGYAGLEDGQVVTGAAVGFALGSLAGLIVSFLLR